MMQLRLKKKKKTWLSWVPSDWKETGETTSQSLSSTFAHSIGIHLQTAVPTVSSRGTDGGILKAPWRWQSEMGRRVRFYVGSNRSPHPRLIPRRPCLIHYSRQPVRMWSTVHSELPRDKQSLSLLLPPLLQSFATYCIRPTPSNLIQLIQSKSEYNAAISLLLLGGN